MAHLNRVMLIGRLTQDPEPTRRLPSGAEVTSFRFAVGRSVKNKQSGQYENDPNPLFIDCEAWGKPDAKRNLSNLVSQHCKRGDQLYIEGRLQFDQWEDKGTGSKRSKHRVAVDNIEFLGGGKGGGGDNGRPVREAVGAGAIGVDEESIPF